jgi:hypothetical protein
VIEMLEEFFKVSSYEGADLRLRLQELKRDELDKQGLTREKMCEVCETKMKLYINYGQ